MTADDVMKAVMVFSANDTAVMMADLLLALLMNLLNL